MRPSLVELSIADPVAHWESLGFAITEEGTCQLGGVTVRLGVEGSGITSWVFRGLPPTQEIDGLPTHVVSGRNDMPHAAHPNRARAIDHVVIVSPDFDRTAAALSGAGMALRRERDGGGFRQGFRRIGAAILELVEAKTAPAGPARFWGLVVVVDDLDALADSLGPRLRAIHPAVQSRRRIATLDRSAGLSPKLAFMTPEPA